MIAAAARSESARRLAANAAYGFRPGAPTAPCRPLSCARKRHFVKTLGFAPRAAMGNDWPRVLAASRVSTPRSSLTISRPTSTDSSLCHRESLPAFIAMDLLMPGISYNCRR